MRRFMIFLLIFVIISGAGFAIYWFIFKDKSDGGSLSNKEVVLALQNVMEDQGVDLTSIIENYQRVNFAPASSMVVYAEDKKGIEEEFSSLLNNLQTFDYDKSNFSKFSAPIIQAYKAMYNNVFNKNGFRQNVWYQIDNCKFKVHSDVEEIINIIAIIDNMYFEIKIDYNYRNENNVYSYEVIILSNNDKFNYEYLYFKRDSEKVLSFDNIKFASSEKYIGNEEDFAFEQKTLIANKFEIYEEQNCYKQFQELTEIEENNIFVYLLKELNVNFKNFDNLKNVKAEKLN